MSKIYQNLLRPLLFRLSAETAHEIGIKALENGFGSKRAQSFFAEKFACHIFGEIERFGLKFKNPLGIAAGFDKNGKIVNQLAALGFGFVEVGTVTFDAQAGNPKPRLFRLSEDKALINRLGFNNEGTFKVVERLKKINPTCVLGVNIGKNKDVSNEDAIENYLKSFDLAHAVADYVAVNVSSPNTPNLRELQKAENLAELLGALQKRNAELNGQNQKTLPLLVKIAPDLLEAEIEAIVDIALRLNLAGIIATNTTVSRENLRAKNSEIERIGAGGLSGKPLKNRSNEVIEQIYKTSKGKLPIVGVGGIFTAEDAFEKIAAGASLLQSYTGFVYQGITFARDVNFGLAKILREKGFSRLDEAVGAANRI
ncbi:MAG TPA: quinone-dependent dihydroorotate dehydrogenase [Pyrinomonadaceae bacterium]|nr:quinone-dependent dihydroorotate dehydrogenase [Pyrinomonadaceae bacterium]